MTSHMRLARLRSRQGMTLIELCIVLIILGNNMGAGVKKGEAIHPAARAKTIIVYNYALTPEEEAGYGRLGYGRFMTRMDLSAALEKGEILELVTH